MLHTVSERFEKEQTAFKLVEAFIPLSPFKSRFRAVIQPEKLDSMIHH